MSNHGTAGTDPLPLSTLLETPEPLQPDDPVTVAAARLRESNLQLLPVVDSDRLVGVVRDNDILHALALPRPQREVATCRQIARPGLTVPLTLQPQEALYLLQHEGNTQLAVVGVDGRYAGVVSRQRVIEALEDAGRPRVVGGMATPFGVHLTSLHHRGGAGDWALAATGLLIVVLTVAAQVSAAALLALTSPDPMLTVTRELGFSLAAVDAVPPPHRWGILLQAGCFLFLLRLSPLAGYHSGEHQVVHALERGQPLTVETVRAMPRPHPRCGTNLVVLLGLLLLLVLTAAGEALSGWAVLPILAGLLCWRKLGWWVQATFTTRPASRRQLEAGVAAMKLLVSGYRADPNRRAGRWRRIWNRGVLQVGLGVAIGHGLLWLVRMSFGWMVERLV